MKRGQLAKVHRIRSESGYEVIRKEMTSIDFLKRHLKVMDQLKETGIVPVLVSVDEAKIALEYEFVDGRHIDEIEEAEHDQVFRMAGVVLAQMHTHHLDGFGVVDNLKKAESDWWSIQDERIDRKLSVCLEFKTLEQREADRLRDIYFELRSSLSEEHESCLSHCDYRSDNLLFMKMKGNWKCIVIDFDHAQGAPAHFDFGRIQLDLFDRWPTHRDSFCLGYESVRPLPNLAGTLPVYRILWPLDLLAWGSINKAEGLTSRMKRLLETENDLI